MQTTIFLSYPQPFLKSQEQFITELVKYLKSRQFNPKTLGVTDYDMEAPLKAIKNLLLECDGLLAVAFKRHKIEKGFSKPNSDLNAIETNISNQWMTSPYCQIEPAMAFQADKPVLIFREVGVLEEGVLEKGVLGLYMPEFNLENSIDEYFRSKEFLDLMIKWESRIRV